MAAPISRLSSSGDTSTRIQALLNPPGPVSPKTSPREPSPRVPQSNGQSPRDNDRLIALFAELVGPLTSLSESAIHLLSSFFEVQDDEVKATIRKVAFKVLNDADKSYNHKHVQAIADARESIEAKVKHLQSVSERAYKEAFVREQCAFESSLWRQEVIERFGPGYIPVIELVKKREFAKIREIRVRIARSTLDESDWKLEMKKIKGKKEAMLSRPCDLDLLFAESAKDFSPYHKFAKEAIASLAVRADKITGAKKISKVINQLRESSKEDRVILFVDSFAKSLLAWMQFQNIMQAARTTPKPHRPHERSLSLGAFTPSGSIGQLKADILKRIDNSRLSKTQVSPITAEQSKAVGVLLSHVGLLKSTLKDMIRLFDLYLEIDQKQDVTVKLRSSSISSRDKEGHVQGFRDILEILRKMKINEKKT